MKQISFSQVEFEGKKRTTRRELFLAEMEQVMPWAELLGVIEPYYPKGKRGRPPMGLKRMLRVYLVQQWYGLSDESVEDAITDSQALRGFVGIDLSRESAPDATTVLQFRHLLAKHDSTKQLFEAINGRLSAAGLMMRKGTTRTRRSSLHLRRSGMRPRLGTRRCTRRKSGTSGTSA